MSCAQFISLLNLQEFTLAGIVVPDDWVVEQPLIFLRANGDKIIVPRGYITDLASIPRVFRGVFDINGLLRAPSVLHDWLYSSQRYSRAECDAVLMEAMIARGMTAAERYAIWAAVRTFGGSHWRTRAKGLGLNAQDFVPPGYFNAAGAR